MPCNYFSIVHQLNMLCQSFPVIVALETSSMPNLSNRASALHAILHGKHASLLNTRYTISARASFDYQRKICSGAVHGNSRSSFRHLWLLTVLYKVSACTRVPSHFCNAGILLYGKRDQRDRTFSRPWSRCSRKIRPTRFPRYVHAPSRMSTDPH